VRSHYGIAFACITYLNISSCFRDPNTSGEEVMIRVAKGFHGLHPYAHEFWFQHLLEYAKFHDDLDSPHYLLESGLKQLQKFWKKDPGIAAKVVKLDDTTTAESIRKQVEALDHAPWLQSMGIDILMFRAYMAQEKFAHQDAESEFSRDPEPFQFTSEEVNIHSLN
jgi:hypothetical protein